MNKIIVGDNTITHLNLKLPSQTEVDHYDYLLTKQHNTLQLIDYQAKFKPFYIDFANHELQKRCKKLKIADELIAKACAVKRHALPTILDATAGLGRDAYILASLGCQLTLLERSAIIYALLQDALQRVAVFSEVQRMQLLEKDAITYCQQGHLFDVVYLDPMFPEKKKNALNKKEMQIFQGLIQDQDTEALFAAAMPCARERVVVKRPIHAEPITSTRKVDIIYKGKKNRFDVYLTYDH